MFFCLGAAAQQYPNGLSMDSVDPKGDAVFIRQIRSKMNYIRAREHRPTVALLLSGGGAKGAAEVGVIRYLEEIGMPVDMVLGTSIGGLIGGLYSVGYRTEEFTELFTTQDWSVMLTDAIPQKYIPYATKMYNAKYVMTIPFHNASDVLDEKRTHERETDRMLDERQSLISSLPSGYAYGFNVNNLLSSLTVGYQDSLAFRDLPTPFVCVATDVVSNKAKNWGSGSLNTAMRSTMSIPGLFAPVRTGGMILVDGGTRNNFPADIARAMGADYIIGVELSDLRPGYEQINNLGDIVNQFISMLGKDAFDKNVPIPDILIKPAISEYNMLSFNRAAVDTMMARGYAAALDKKDELLRLRDEVGKAKEKDRGRKAVNLALTPVKVGQIEFAGVDGHEEQLLASLVDIMPGDSLDKARIDDAMCKLQATGAFASVKYSLLGSEEPYKLVFECVTSPTNSIGIGIRMDTVEWVSLLFNVGLNTNRLTGSRFNFNTKIGQNLKATAHYAYNQAGMPTLNLEATAFRYKGTISERVDAINMDASFWGHREQFYLTDVRWTKANFKIGFKNDFYSFNENTVLGNAITSYLGDSALRGDFIGAFAKGNWYSFDNYYYPSRGSSLALAANYDFIRLGDKDFTPILMMGADYRKVFPTGDKVAIIADLHARSIINSGATDQDHYSSQMSLMHSNIFGGFIKGRFTEFQVPFFAVNSVAFASDHIATAVLECRVNPYKKLYLSAMAGVEESNDNFTKLITEYNPDCLAFGLEAAYNFIGGPVKFNLHWSKAFGWGAYASLGFDF